MKTIFGLFLIISTLWIQGIKATSPLDVDIGLYHASHQAAAAENCTVVRLPWNICPACKLKPFNGTGADLDFGGVNRFDIYDLDDPVCRNSIRKYLEYNECDEKRKEAFMKLEQVNFNITETKALNAYKVMIYFMYSVCETCCDCVPIGSKIEEYDERKKNGTLIKIERGNCAAHYHYDTCRIWPNAGQVTGLKGNEFINKPLWCPDFKNWLGSPDSKGWLKNPEVRGLTWKMKRAMNQLMRKARCAERTQWENCVRMEKAQNRV